MSQAETKRVSMVSVLCRAVPELFRAEPLGSSLLSLILLVQACVPVLTLYLTRVTLDGVTARLEGEPVSLTLLATFWALTLLIDVVLSPISSVLQGNVGEKFTAYINLKLMNKAHTLAGLELLEDKRFYDDLELLQSGAANRPLNTLMMLFYTGRTLVTFAGIAGLLLGIGWWVPLVALAGAAPLSVATFRSRKKTFEALLRQTPESRAMAYESELALSYRSAAEVRLYGLLPWLRERYSRAFVSAHQRMRQVRTTQALIVTPTGILSLLVTAGLFTWTIFRASSGHLSVGQIVLVISGLNQLQGLLFTLIEETSWLYDRALYFDKYFDFLAATPQVTNSENGVRLEAGAPHIRFEAVSFRYPDGRYALQDVSFEVRPGETVAVVGENGAGKTTLAKLLLRFYDANEGTVTVNGHDIRTLELSAWRKRVAAVFQDFGRYAYSVRENITLADNDTPNDERLDRAINQSGFEGVLEALPEGLETRLGKAFGGTELSGGQWQKLALARALYRDADLLILDEPTAALDPRSEADIFRQFIALAEGKSALVITHRLGSVLSADRILVLKAGQLIEQGTHQDLIAQKGEYAELWQLQAAQYRKVSL